MFFSRFRPLSRRFIHLKARPEEKKFEEIKIPLPWGHIAGKWWGDTSKVPIVGIHGLFDNAATFDKLVPLLETPSFLALDLPGHGKSSHYPPGVMFHFYDDIFNLRYILKNHFKWDNLTLMGHSFGGALFYHYSAIYPEQVRKFISLDGATYVLVSNENRTAADHKSFTESLFEHEEKVKNPPEVFDTFEDIVDAMYRKRRDNNPPSLSISKDACRILLSRGSRTTVNGKFCFSRDVRLRTKSFGRPTIPFIYALAERITCEVLLVRAKKGIVDGKWLQAYDRSLQHMQKKSKRVEFCIVDGHHHVHLEKPEEVAHVVNRFLNS